MADIATQLKEIFDWFTKTGDSAGAADKAVTALGESMKSNTLTADDARKMFDGFARSIGLSGEALTKANRALQDTASSLKEVLSYLENTAKFERWFNEFGKKSDEVLNKFKAKLGDSGLNTEAFAAKMAMVGASTFGLTAFPKHFEALGQSVRNSQAQLTDMIDTIPGLKIALEKLMPSEFKGNIRLFAQQVDAVRNLEGGMLRAASASGQLNETFALIQAGGPKALEKMANQYNTEVAKMTAATGKSADSVSGLLNKLMAMPGGFDAATKSGMIAGKQISELQAVLQVADGTAQDSSAVFDQMSKSIATFGMTSEDALTFVARMSDAANATHMPLEKMQELIQGSADSLFMFAKNGDQAAAMTNSVVTVTGRMSAALRDSGASIQQTNKIVKDMMDGMNGMTTAQKGFLSASTGGPGGLQGAFAIDKMLEEGKVDEVFSKMRSNMMQRLGGNIVTRDQAAADPGAAAQFQKQIMFMMSPAMGGMAKDERSAVKLLDAMSKGEAKLPEGMGPGDTKEGRQAALNKTMEKGVQWQEKTYNVLAGMAGESMQMGGLGAIASRSVERNTLGSQSDFGLKGFNEAQNRAAATALAGSRTQVFSEGGRDPNKDYQALANKTIRDPLKALMDAMLGTGALPDIAGPTSNMRKQMKEAGESPSALPQRRYIASPSSSLLDANSMAQRTFMRTQDAQRTQRARDMVARGQKSDTAKLDVTVTTVCETCKHTLDKKSANDTKTHITRHASEQDKVSGFMGFSEQ